MGNGNGNGNGFYLVPHIVVEHVSEIDPALLMMMGKKAALIDLDNTLLEWGTEEFTPEVVQWVKDALAAGLKICILSNTRSYRVALFGCQLGVPYVGVALKPSRRAARGALKLLDVSVDEAVIIGDQIFTDILMGRRLGLYTILVKPMQMREQFWMRMVRRIERMFWPSASEDAIAKPANEGDASRRHAKPGLAL